MTCGIPVLAFMIGPMEIALIAVAGLLVFGNRLPEVGKSLGRSVVEFKKGIKGISDEIEKASDGDDDNNKRLTP